MTVHNEARKEDIAKVVIMPGDPLRAKYIAKNFLDNPREVNTIRNNLAYTGWYNGREVTVMSSGMGMPSMGIYCYELYKIYDVDVIIRTGSCGVYVDGVDLLDTILVDGSYTLGNFAMNYDGQDEHYVKADEELNNKIEEVARENNIPLKRCNMACTECFDPYVDDPERVLNSFPKELNIVGSEMEAFSLMYTAKRLGKKAACMLTVVDSIIDKRGLTSDERRSSLNDMIKIALESL